MSTTPRGSAAGRPLPFELRMALRYLTTRRREGPVTLVTVLCSVGVLVGVAALVLGLALTTGLHGDVRARLLSNNPHVVVGPPWGRAALTAEEAEAIAAAALEVPGVVAAAPATETAALVSSGKFPAGLPVVVRAIDPGREDAVTGLASAASTVAWQRLGAHGRDRAPAAPESDDEPLDLQRIAVEPPPILLGMDLSLQLGAAPGDVVRLITADVTLRPRSRAFRVAGTLRTGLHEYDSTWAVVPLSAHEEAAGVGSVALALAEPLRSVEVAGRLRERLGPDLRVADWTTTFSRLFAAYKWERLIMAIALGLIGLVAGFNIFTILTMNVMARIPDIGILAALGTTSGRITRIFTWMGLGIGGAGTLCGLGVGALVAVLLDRHEVVRLDPAVYFVSHVPFRVAPGDLVIVALIMLAISLLATLPPARWAARLDPVVALRAE